MSELPTFEVRYGDLGAMSAKLNREHAAAEIVQYHATGDTRHVVAFVSHPDKDGVCDIEFVGRRPFEVDWWEFRKLCLVALNIIERGGNA